eukprot:149359_1
MLTLFVSMLLCLWFPLNQSQSQSQFQCKSNINDDDVDWWFLYKLPGKKDCKVGPNRFIYYDSTMGAIKPPFDTYPLKPYSEQEEPKYGSAMEFTLQQIYEQKHDPNYVWLAYSDQPPPKKRSSDSVAHSKGVLAYDTSDKSGFWIVHSQPAFPSFKDDRYTFTKTSGGPSPKYAQQFMCISFNGENRFSHIKQQLSRIGANIYDSNPKG